MKGNLSEKEQVFVKRCAQYREGVFEATSDGYQRIAELFPPIWVAFDRLPLVDLIDVWALYRELVP